MKKRFLFNIGFAASLLFNLQHASACDFSDDFSSAVPWTQLGSGVHVSSGNCVYNPAVCGSDQRVFRSLSPTTSMLDNTSWTALVDFMPQTTFSSGVAHSIISFTSNTLNPYRYTSSGSYTPTDFIEILYSSPINTGFSQWKLYASAKDGANAGQVSSAGISLPSLNTWYYLELQRSGNTVTVSAFSDPARTIPLSGSPVSLTFTGSITNLAYVQSGSVIQGAASRKLNALIDNICVTGLRAGGNCDVWSDYTSSTGWTQINSGVSITGGNVLYNNVADGGHIQRRVYESLGGDITGANTWKADFDFYPTAVGTGGPGHTLCGITAGTQDPFCDDSYTATNQDAIAACWISNNHTDDPSTFMLDGRAKDGNGAWSTSAGILLSLGTHYYITLERLDEFNGRISAFLDAGRTIHAPGSPQCFTIPPGVFNLDYVQHGSIPWGGDDRALTATVDNFCLKADYLNPGTVSYNGPLSFCASGTPSVISSETPATGGNWTWNYQWQQSVNCNGVWTDIAGATGTSYTPSSISTSTCYRRAALGPCGVAVYSNVIGILVYQPLSANITSTETGDHCTASYTLTANPSNPTGVTYLWNTGATTQSIVVGNPNSPTTYSVTVTSPCYTATASYVVYPCYHPSGAFPTISANSWFEVNWSGGCTGSCYLQFIDPAYPVGGGPAYGVTQAELLVFDRWGNMLYDQVYVPSPPCDGLWNGQIIWNGIYMGYPVVDGDYDYVLKRTNCSGNDEVRGSVVVLGTARMASHDADTTVATYTPPLSVVYPNPSAGVFNVDLLPSINNVDVTMEV
ncbi:MAG TPA: hypothetical protein VFU15_05530, partial [Bacteroidia bacterium]|nr:hypothetical protein [Bacteroidia bacterium]